MAPTPGLLYVTMQPQGSLSDAAFHDWYNNEHGPMRLRLPFCHSGLRYRAADGAKPGWLAMYDISDMAELVKPLYLSLRCPPMKTEREKEAMSQIDVRRKLYDLVGDWKAEGFKAAEERWRDGDSSNYIVSATFTLKDESMKEEMGKWYDEEHIPMLRRVPGWRRSRRYVTSCVDQGAELEILALHEYAPENGIGGPEYQAATSTKWRDDIFTNVVKDKARRTFNLCYNFGPAPRYLSIVTKWASSDGKTKTLPGSSPGESGAAVESFITTKDGVEIPYRLEGSADVSAPLIVLSNSILVEWGIWDSFIKSFFSNPVNKRYRILRYHTRGRSAVAGEEKVTVDLLASDVIALLDALRVQKAAAVIGVSLGGATALKTALEYPDRVSAFVACDTNAKAPPSNPKAWGERIEVAEKEGAEKDGEKIVGRNLAEMTVRRWFVKESYDGGRTEEEIARVKSMVERNSLPGFKKSVQALYQYEFVDEMKTCPVKGAFLVGSGDGILPETMKGMSEQYGKGAELFVVDGAGHLPMVEKPDEFAKIVTNFLSS